jgi:glycosyl transferase, family 25
MQAYLINMDSHKDRLAFQTSQLNKLNIGFARISAVKPNELLIAETDPYWNKWQRPLSFGEKSCLTSHILAWQEIAKLDKPAMVLEDDAIFLNDINSLILALENIKDIDYLNLETRARKKLIGKSHKILLARELFMDRNGSAGYILWPTGAKKLLAKAKKRPGLADEFISTTFHLKAWQTWPAQIIQMDLCENYGLLPPIKTQSSISAPPKKTIEVSIGQKIIFRIRRIIGQLRFGWRILTKSHGAKRLIPPIK